MPKQPGERGMPTEHGGPAELADLIERLYAEPPERFVATRAAAVDDARAAGDRDTAKRIGALRKPTVAAWLVNLLALRRPDLLDELVELAAALRTAQRDLHGEQLRELSTQRRKVVSALVTEARRLALTADGSLSAAKLPLSEVETTLTAALSDTDVAEQVRSGRLIRAATYAGFGEVPRPRLRLVTTDDTADEEDGPAADAEDTDGEEDDNDGTAAGGVRNAAGGRTGGVVKAAPDGPDRSVWAEREARRKAEAAQAAAEQRLAEARRELSRELAAARSAETRAQKQLERAEAAESDAGHAVAELDVALAALEQRRAAAQADVSHRKLARRAAQRDTAAARRRVGDVQAALEALDDGPQG